MCPHPPPGPAAVRTYPMFMSLPPHGTTVLRAARCGQRRRSWVHVVDRLSPDVPSRGRVGVGEGTMNRGRVVAGFDGSPAAGQAVRWAAAEAFVRGVPLVVCHAWNWPYPSRPRDETAVEIVRELGAMAVSEDGRP
ncbi:universal stress protein [Actinomadura sp. NTSP31]|uniref:universal stress protein n=1 Tax=Actinomadura sp. NTSP31 TaxID=1735447 RepID=UPI0035BFB7D7